MSPPWSEPPCHRHRTVTTTATIASMPAATSHRHTYTPAPTRRSRRRGSSSALALALALHLHLLLSVLLGVPLLGGAAICVCAADLHPAATCSADGADCPDDAADVAGQTSNMGPGTQRANRVPGTDDASGSASAATDRPADAAPSDSDSADDLPCVYRSDRCSEWAAAGECGNNPMFMTTVCYSLCTHPGQPCVPTAALAHGHIGPCAAPVSLGRARGGLSPLV